MMNIIRLYGLLSLILLVPSCYNKSKNESSNVHSLRNDIVSDTCFVEVNRYKNGSISSTGQICNGEMQGLWQAFYSDGTLKWKGYYEQGYRTLPKLDSLPRSCEFVFEQNADFSLRKGFQFRVLAPPLGPKDMIIHINSGRFAQPLDPDNFDYMVVPTTLGELCIELDYGHRSGFPICKKCILIHS